MTHLPQDLHDVFPADAELLRQLKAEDRHFQALSARYADLDAQIHRIEGEQEPATDSALEDLKKQRLAVLDDIAATLAQRRAA